MAEDKQASGAPDTNVIGHGERRVIWNEKNILVDPEMDAHFKEQSDIVLGVSKPSGDGEATSTRAGGENGLIEPVSPNAPYVSQQQEGQTRDVLTSPEPDSDPNNRPTFIDGYTEAQAALDRAVIDGAKALDAEQAVDNSIAREVPQKPVRSDETGNVRGNPAGAQGGNVPATDTTAPASSAPDSTASNAEPVPTTKRTVPPKSE